MIHISEIITHFSDKVVTPDYTSIGLGLLHPNAVICSDKFVPRPYVFISDIRLHESYLVAANDTNIWVFLQCNANRPQLSINHLTIQNPIIVGVSGTWIHEDLQRCIYNV